MIHNARRDVYDLSKHPLRNNVYSPNFDSDNENCNEANGDDFFDSRLLPRSNFKLLNMREKEEAIFRMLSLIRYLVPC